MCFGRGEGNGEVEEQEQERILQGSRCHFIKKCNENICRVIERVNNSTFCQKSLASLGLVCLVHGGGRCGRNNLAAVDSSRTWQKPILIFLPTSYWWLFTPLRQPKCARKPENPKKSRHSYPECEFRFLFVWKLPTPSSAMITAYYLTHADLGLTFSPQAPPYSPHPNRQLPSPPPPHTSSFPSLIDSCHSLSLWSRNVIGFWSEFIQRVSVFSKLSAGNVNTEP